MDDGLAFSPPGLPVRRWVTSSCKRAFGVCLASLPVLRRVLVGPGESLLGDSMDVNMYQWFTSVKYQKYIFLSKA